MLLDRRPIEQATLNQLLTSGLNSPRQYQLVADPERRHHRGPLVGGRVEGVHELVLWRRIDLSDVLRATLEFIVVALLPLNFLLRTSSLGGLRHFAIRIHRLLLHARLLRDRLDTAGARIGAVREIAGIRRLR